MPELKADALQMIQGPPVATPLNEEEIEAMVAAVRSGNSLGIGGTGGPENDAFESEFTEHCGCAASVAVNSGSSALELTALLTRVGPGDEVILPAHTFVSSAVPFGRTGATIKWADIEQGTHLLSAASVESLITPKTKVIVAVHLYGLPVEMDPIMALAKKHGLLVVEDCAQAPGAKYRGRRVGSIGDFGCFSFHTAKNITTLGEGGMLTVRDARHALEARRMRWMGNWPFEGQREKDWIPAGNNLVEPYPGGWPVNFCMNVPAIVVGRLLLQRLDTINDQRRRQAQRFIGALSDYKEIEFQNVPDHCEHAYHLMVSQYDAQSTGHDRDELFKLLRDKYRLKVIVQYWPLYHSELFRSHGFGEADVPETDRFYAGMVSFPWWSDMGDDVLDDMADRTRRGLDEFRAI